MTGNTPLKLISMSEINAEKVQWLWYPYIPLGKLTILQGDPGEGKGSVKIYAQKDLQAPACESRPQQKTTSNLGWGWMLFGK